MKRKKPRVPRPLRRMGTEVVKDRRTRRARQRRQAERRAIEEEQDLRGE